MEKKAIIAPGVTHVDARHYNKHAASKSTKSKLAQLDNDFTRTAAQRMKTALTHGS